MGGVVTLHKGDCLTVLDEFPDNHFDAVACDPPYHLLSIIKRFGGDNAAPAGKGTDGNFARSSQKFEGKTWDGGDIAFRPEAWAKIKRVMKPGAHLVAFNHSTVWHRMAIAIEDAGFEIRDTLFWLYGTGFPKSHNISKAMDKLAGAQREFPDVPVTSEAEYYRGYGTALKPAVEPIVLARKPLAETSIARQVLATGTGALNIDAGRVGTRWPANLVHDGSAEVVSRFPVNPLPGQGHGTQSAARFFYCTKANRSDRAGSNHPTVKPQALMKWLTRMVCPTGGRLLDPFAGSGSTGWAAAAQGFDADLIEMDPEYQADIARGIADLAIAQTALTDPTPDALPGQASLFEPY